MCIHTGYAQVLEEWSPSGSHPDVTYTVGDDVVTQYDSTNGARHLLYDGHGSTRQLVDNNEDVTDAFSYDGYGVMLGANPASAATSLLYTGEMYDSSASMYYLRARWYDQQTGRFNRMDPFAGNNQDPQSLHKYLYAHSNPVNVTDKSGLFGSYIDVMSTAYVRSVLANLQQSVGDYVFLSVEAARAGWSVAQTFKWALAITIGVAVGAWLLGKVLKVIRRLPSLFRSSADDLPRGIAFRGTVWRAVPHQFADDAWEMTAKNIANHHRYSGTGRGALYAGTSHTTALKEILAYKIDPATRTFVSKEVVLDNLLDLTDPAVRDWLGVSLADLTQTTGDRVGDYFLPNAIGDFARSRYNGLLVPSARHPAGKNLVMFTPL